MAVRSLTDAFILMRSNAIQNKNVFNRNHTYEYDEDDTVALVGNRHAKETKVSFKKTISTEWSNISQDIQYEMSRIKDKMDELIEMHNKHLTRPTLDDTADEEHGIEIFTHEITQLFHKCHHNIKAMNKIIERANDQEKVLLNNAVSTHAATLQSYSLDFRKRQNAYLKKLKAREERSHHYFSANTAIMIEEDDIPDEFFERGFSDSQVAVIQKNAVDIEQREEEIRSVVQSITDLAEIFKDLSQLVIEQGTILDRIDYNIEQTVVKTETGMEQLQKAESYQKQNKKMLIIFVLAIVVTVLLVVLIVKKT